MTETFASSSGALSTTGGYSVGVVEWCVGKGLAVRALVVAGPVA